MTTIVIIYLWLLFKNKIINIRHFHSELNLQFRRINMSNIFLSANILLSDIGMGTTQHEIVKWPIVIKDFTLEIEFWIQCMWLLCDVLNCHANTQFTNSAKKEATLVTIKSYVSRLSSK